MTLRSHSSHYFFAWDLLSKTHFGSFSIIPNYAFIQSTGLLSLRVIEKWNQGLLFAAITTTFFIIIAFMRTFPVSMLYAQPLKTLMRLPRREN